MLLAFPRLYALLACLVILPFCASGIVRLDSSFDVDDADYINFGNQFEAVGQVSGGALGSGVLVAPTYVLTARHLNLNSDTFTINGQDYTVAEIIQPGGYNSTTRANDIMLLRLNQAVAGVTPMSIISQGDTSYIGQEVIFAGTGQTGTGITGDGGAYGTRRAGTNVADVLSSNPTVQTFISNYNETSFLADFDNNTSGENTLNNAPFLFGSSQVPTSLEGSVGQGDSGGAAIYEISPGNYTIVGIGSTEFILSGNDGGQYGNLSSYTRVDLFSDWIAANIPEPGQVPLGLGAAALGLTLITRRRLRLS